ncbi:MAG TPA: Gfo/Idh/MocA family oxidoreductase [Verrucomicrobiae bacterium]|nr:Gfo/Idh/MocA family oxidoreductase [Verrucomicrobiae bacterium]
MTEQENRPPDFNRRDFLKSGSVATLMTMMGGVELFAQTNAAAPADNKVVGARVKIGVIGLGNWGREIVNTLTRNPQAELVAICDTYPASLRRIADAAPGAAKIPDYKALLANKDIKAVVVATPTHQHKEIVLAALQAGKHVYCEAPIAHTIDDARAIAAAAKAARQCVFQAGLQLRSDPQRHFLLPFIRSGAMGQPIFARAQWHKKTSWRSTSPKPEREKELNWRLSKETSPGLISEVGCHPVDQATLFLDGLPTAVSGFGSVVFWKDGRDVPDTVQAMLEFPSGVQMIYDATLANSFDADYEILYGSDAAVMMRRGKNGDSKAWLFKEVDSPLLGWEVYAHKDEFYQETGIALVANASKSTPPSEAQTAEQLLTTSTLYKALDAFLLNSRDVTAALDDAIALLGPDDPNALGEQAAKVARRPAAGYLEGYRAAVITLTANQAILARQRLEIKPELYELG